MNIFPTETIQLATRMEGEAVIEVLNENESIGKYPESQTRKQMWIPEKLPD
ncbi:hypothetical protein [Nitrosomonas sp.]|uniref:hypothetical protein n=1 Tax=Nitrosomonas sp. TaxID=42353 RepID=UPI003305DB2F